MELETLWGTVKTRRVSTRLSRKHYIFLKDNPSLEPLFEWLKNMNIKKTDDFRNEIIKNALSRILVETEVKWRVAETEIPSILFENSYPFNGNFEQAIKQYLNLLREIMYSPEKFLEVQI